jgi:hypothetical protein
MCMIIILEKYKSIHRIKWRSFVWKLAFSFFSLKKGFYKLIGGGGGGGGGGRGVLLPILLLASVTAWWGDFGRPFQEIYYDARRIFIQFLSNERLYCTNVIS